MQCRSSHKYNLTSGMALLRINIRRSLDLAAAPLPFRIVLSRPKSLNAEKDLGADVCAGLVLSTHFVCESSAIHLLPKLLHVSSY